MKEIKAYIRTSKVETVLQNLHDIGIDALTIIDVMALGRGMMDPKQYKYSVECVDRYSKIAKIEIVCTDEDLEDITEVIRSCAYSGDGLIFISDVSQAIKIRTGETGSRFLQPNQQNHFKKKEVS